MEKNSITGNLKDFRTGPAPSREQQKSEFLPELRAGGWNMLFLKTRVPI